MKQVLKQFAVIFFVLISGLAKSEISNTNDIPDSVYLSIRNIKYYLNQYNQWYAQDQKVAKQMSSLIDYIENQKVDTLVKDLSAYQASESRYFFRTIDNAQDSLQAPGYVKHSIVKEELAKIDRQVRSDILPNSIDVPAELIAKAQESVRLISQSEADTLIAIGFVELPAHLQQIDDSPISEDISVEEFQEIQARDSLRHSILEKARADYNAQILQQVSDSVSSVYREEVITYESNRKQKAYANSIKQKNYINLRKYNQQQIAKANQKVHESLAVLINHINNEQLSFWIHNTAEDSTKISLSYNNPSASRLFIKNIQQDSLSVQIYGRNRNSLQLFIDDGVELNRFEERKPKESNLGNVNIRNNLDKIDKRYEIVTPWTLGSKFYFAFTQTYLDNWVKGGESSLATLLTINAYANYKLDKIEWKNSMDMRAGWISPSDGGLQKNEDRFRLTSNFGLRAYKKWFYSAEVDLETQLFNSYNYPDRTNPKSGFLAPAKLLFKLGMDYKGSNNLSLFVSPITMKSVFVRDTTIFNQTAFGIEKDKKSFWDVGLNLDLTYKKQILDNLNWKSKYRMFIDYQNIVTAYDIDWENTFDFNISRMLKAQLILHLLYDDNVTFDTGRVDADGKEIKKAKWQFKEFVTIGFTYTIDVERKIRRKIPK